MRLAISLSGTDEGRSGIGVYVREVVPRLTAAVTAAGGTVVLLGAPSDIDAYAFHLAHTSVARWPRMTRGPLAGALWHAAFAGSSAVAHGADVLLLPAANRRVAFTRALPTVAVVHDLAQLHVEGKYDPLRMFYVRQIVTRGLAAATELVAVSKATAVDTAAVVPSRGGHVRVVENGVDAGRFVPMQASDHRVAAVREEHGLRRPYLLYVSRLEHPGKNHLRLLEAFASSAVARSHDLVLAGGDWGAQALITARASELGASAHVRLLGRVSDTSLPPLVAGARAVAMVGLREGFGLPALEALAAGRPVLASSVGALPEVVGELGVLADPLDVGALRRGVERILSDEALAHRAATEGPPSAAARTWDRTAEGLWAACQAAHRRRTP